MPLVYTLLEVALRDFEGMRLLGDVVLVTLPRLRCRAS